MRRKGIVWYKHVFQIHYRMIFGISQNRHVIYSNFSENNELKLNKRIESSSEWHRENEETKDTTRIEKKWRTKMPGKKFKNFKSTQAINETDQKQKQVKRYTYCRAIEAKSKKKNKQTKHLNHIGFRLRWKWMWFCIYFFPISFCICSVFYTFNFVQLAVLSEFRLVVTFNWYQKDRSTVTNARVKWK